ncbi:AAA family ATPase [Vibrio parahaemolyticus]|nr:AAA family ATPase [Vibrio parahaemolyticus]
MKLSTLNLANYRGYDQLPLTLDSELTVIAGVNGVGKSSLISAIVHSASQLLPQVTSSKEASIGLAATDIKAGKDNLSVSAVFETKESKLLVDTIRKESVSEEEAKQLTEDIKKLRAEIRETSKRSSEEKVLQDRIRIIESRLSPTEDNSSVRIVPSSSITTDDLIMTMKNAVAQPVVVYYSTSRFISRLPPVLGKTKKIDISSAYLKSLNQLEVSLYELANWYRVQLEDKSRAGVLFEQLNQAVGVFFRKCR